LVKLVELVESREKLKKACRANRQAFFEHEKKSFHIKKQDCSPGTVRRNDDDDV